MSRLKALLAHPGTQYSFHLARELAHHQRLSSFYTCLAFKKGSLVTMAAAVLLKLLGQQKIYENRLISDVPASLVNSIPQLEFQALKQSRRGMSEVEVLRQRNDRFQTLIPDKALDDAQVVVGFDTSSQLLAARAKALGKKFILDRSIAYAPGVRCLFNGFHLKFPEWPDTWLIKSEADFGIEESEHQLADLIVVPSGFVARSLVNAGVPRSKIRIIPFGTDLISFQPARQAPNGDHLIFLFVGSLTARKGVPLLLQAWKRLKPHNAELWLAGAGNIPPEAGPLPESVRLIGPVSRRKLPSLYQKANVFVFPSFFEGLAQVQVEAAACGLPVIGTTASGAAEIIEDGITGFLIEPGNLEQLIERLQRFIESPRLAREMHQLLRGANSLSWRVYGDRWNRILDEIA